MVACIVHILSIDFSKTSLLFISGTNLVRTMFMCGAEEEGSTSVKSVESAVRSQVC